MCGIADWQEVSDQWEEYDNEREARGLAAEREEAYADIRDMMERLYELSDSLPEMEEFEYAAEVFFDAWQKLEGKYGD